MRARVFARRPRREQLLRAAYVAVARDEAHVTDYLAKEIIESSGKLPADGSTSN